MDETSILPGSIVEYLRKNSLEYYGRVGIVLSVVYDDAYVMWFNDALQMEFAWFSTSSLRKAKGLKTSMLW